eukprot:TRINITY_DN10135_c0_g1_i1.p1 TRINITY_DN10135_c0_g1~~TRINITY_DN10135_c0_g1_i1.p1  ORF type:complete len:229 (+),score=32.48 TRINITY_DN10135_c0_g1_i1:160-846(+)
MHRQCQTAARLFPPWCLEGRNFNKRKFRFPRVASTQFEKMPCVMVITASVRHGRVGPRITEWLVDLIPAIETVQIEIVDLADWVLPLNDDAAIPAEVDTVANYTSEHTRAWSSKISSGDAFVFVTPQYNWGYPAGLKNALDHLYKEWKTKPAMIVSYGSRGGGKAAAQLRQVLDGLRMRTVSTMPALIIAKAALYEDLAAAKVAFADYVDTARAAYAELIQLLLSPKQ